MPLYIATFHTSGSFPFFLFLSLVIVLYAMLDQTMSSLSHVVSPETSEKPQLGDSAGDLSSRHDLDVIDEDHVNDAVPRIRGHTKNDKKDMRRLGKRQQLMVRRPIVLCERVLKIHQRNFGGISAFSFTIILQATWEFLLMYVVTKPDDAEKWAPTNLFPAQTPKVLLTAGWPACFGHIYGPFSDSVSSRCRWQKWHPCQWNSFPEAPPALTLFIQVAHIWRPIPLGV